MATHQSEDKLLAEERDTHEFVDQVERRKPYQPYLEAELGLRDHWYAVMFGEEIAEGGFRGEMVLGERILFKRAGGKVYGIADRCPHRGASFSARPECYSANTVTCWFHGFTFDIRDGKLVQILTEPGSKLIGKLKHKVYPVEEINGVVFVFIGDMDPPPPIAEDLQPMFLEKGLEFHPVCRNKVRANWRIAAENGYDAAHIYGHRHAGLFQAANVAVPLGTYPSSKDVVQVLDGPRGPWGITKADDVNIWSVEVEGVTVTAPNATLGGPPPDYEITVGLFMPCGLQVTHFPVSHLWHFEWYTPVDEDHHLYMITHATRAGSPEEMARFHDECERIYGPMVWQQPGNQSDPVGDGPSWGFNNFDAFGREQIHHAYQYEDHWHRERLYRPDYIIVRWRMLVASHLRGIQRRGEWARTRGWSPDGRDYDPRKGPRR
jgi:carbazole 1,9a-dioxygenase terminal dioxygenase component